MDFINQAWFDKPEARLEASGANLRSPRSAIMSPSGDVLAYITNGGIINPRRTVLAAGTCMVRLGGSGLPHIAIAGNWWLDWQQYKLVERFADKRGLPMPVAMRLLACVPPEWNEMTVLLKTRLKVPVLAYTGNSAPVIDRDRRTGTSTYLSGIDDAGGLIEQLYIPGMVSPDMRHDCLMLEGYGHLPQELSMRGYIIRTNA
jgi:hypothetical protein